MRPTQKSNRTRGRGNRKSNGNNLNRVYDSSGPEGKVRGTPQQIIDKYLSLARDAQTSGDRVMAENFLQHAEHYQRILIQASQGQAERRDQHGAEDDDGAETSHGFDQPQDRGRRREEPQAQEPQPQAEAPRPPEGEGNPLATIDPEGDEGESLLVAADEVSASQPAQPRKRRSRSQKTNGAANGADAEPAEAGEQRSESA